MVVIKVMGSLSLTAELSIYRNLGSMQGESITCKLQPLGQNIYSSLDIVQDSINSIKVVIFSL